ncbi:PREDICTED: NACHT, LRR and PYD domains-containing protein 3-like isoform X2 [Amphimedon queenslandica]|uniref:NACHT domain-containing protein n=1 Tax=Amphimedon queenslandica TaxID=400682 RepID=A0A1X7UVY6_AMPQE|nr:PREDICTED: NACHT, LRR and PYD domains-containing protein 3-like isoform X2 [Amphimedon queenslandica]|eukprot:XP_019852054.1 PREDICTED: NACHT, LRR and PYD domains-containing protein 3-like isoform X2 [Amphimedon queenslandica]
MASVTATRNLDITHLRLVLSKLQHFSKARWKDFGLNCGLYYNTVTAIEASNAGKPDSVDECFRECVARWLKREDDVDEVGEPTLKRLANIVEETGDKSTAKKIRSQFKEHNCKADQTTKPEHSSLLPLIVILVIIVLAIIMHESSIIDIHDEYASKLRDKYNEALTRYKDPDVNKFPAAGPSVQGYVPFIPLISIIVKEYRKEDADFLLTSSTNEVIQEDNIFEKIEIENILKPQTDKPLKFVIIAGEPGIGKSTLAKELTLRWVRKTDELLNSYKIIILIPLRFETNQKAKNIKDLLIDVDDINETEVMLSINKTKGADILWILDGFDELPHHLRTNSTSIFIKLIKGDILPKSTVIVTSRHAATDPLLTFLEDDSKHIALRGFGSNEILEYASKYFKNETVTSEFQYFYSRNTVIENMLYNPMNCFIMCKIFTRFYTY